MQMQPMTDGFTELRPPAVTRILLPCLSIFSVTDNGMSDPCHMRTQLMGTARDWCQRHPSRPAAKIGQNGIIGMGMPGTGRMIDLGRMNTQHPFPPSSRIAAGCLDQPVCDTTHSGMRNAGNNGPVDLADFPTTKSRRQCRGSRAGTRHEKNTRCIPVQPVNKTWILIALETQSRSERIDMARLPAATLYCKTWRLVQDQKMIVAINDAGLDQSRARLINPEGVSVRAGRFGRKGRNTDRLTCHDPRAGPGPATVHTQFTLSAHSLDPALIELRESAFQPSVETLVLFCFGHDQGLHTAHAKTARASRAPRNKPKMERPTDNAT